MKQVFRTVTKHHLCTNCSFKHYTISKFCVNIISRASPHSFNEPGRKGYQCVTDSLHHHTLRLHMTHSVTHSSLTSFLSCLKRHQDNNLPCLAASTWLMVFSRRSLEHSAPLQCLLRAEHKAKLLSLLTMCIT